MASNKKMKEFIARVKKNQSPEVNLDLNFSRVGSGYFFTQCIHASVRRVAKIYKTDPSFDWARYEYTINKIHLTDRIEGSFEQMGLAGLHLVEAAAKKFSERYKNVSAIFWLSVNEFTEFPSICLSFYVIRKGDLPILPVDEDVLDRFMDAAVVISV